MSRFLVLLSLFFSLLTAGSNQPVTQVQIPRTGASGTAPTQLTNLSSLPSLLNFIPAIQNGKARQLVGVYADQAFALQIVQQPSSNPGFVSSEPEVVTQFALASQYGSIGLLAHNTAAGDYFDLLQTGQKITLVYGDGHLKSYRVSQIRQFQALLPTNPYSNFKELTAPDKILSVETLFYQIYQSNGNLILQTCIEKDGESSWGRLFVIAAPIVLPAPESIKSLRRLSGDHGLASGLV